MRKAQLEELSSDVGLMYVIARGSLLRVIRLPLYLK
jgi:hypothetical protein